MVIPSAVNTQVFKPVSQAEARKRLGLEQEGRIIVYVGRMLPRKDIRNIVRALALLAQQEEKGTDSTLPQATLMVVGGETVEPDPEATPEIGELQRLAAELGVSERVRFIGKRQANELRYYYCAGDVAVTTPWYEPFGLTPLEAMACGAPVISSRIPSITEVLGTAARLVVPTDVHDLSESIIELWENADERQRLSKAGQTRAAEFCWERTARLTREVYATALGSRNANSP